MPLFVERMGWCRPAVALNGIRRRGGFLEEFGELIHGGRGGADLSEGSWRHLVQRHFAIGGEGELLRALRFQGFDLRW